MNFKFNIFMTNIIFNFIISIFTLIDLIADRIFSNFCKLIFKTTK